MYPTSCQRWSSVSGPLNLHVSREKKGEPTFMPSCHLAKGKRREPILSPYSRWSRKQVVPPVGNFHLIYSIRQTTSSSGKHSGERATTLDRSCFRFVFSPSSPSPPSMTVSGKTFGFTRRYLAILSRTSRKIFANRKEIVHIYLHLGKVLRKRKREKLSYSGVLIFYEKINFI